MVDRNNLNRIKGILSAKQGAEVPKFQNPAGPMLWNGAGSKEIKFHKKNGNASIYSHDGVNWFQDVGLAIPYQGNLDGYVDASELETRSLLAIPGEQKVTPTTAVENASIANAAIEAAKNELVIQATASQAAKREPLPELPKINTPMNMTPGAVVLNPSNTLAGVSNSSSGMTLSEAQLAQIKVNLEQSNKVKKLGNVGLVAADAITSVGNVIGAKLAATDSNLTKGLDTAYGAVADIASNFGPIGQAVGTALKTFGAAGNIIQELGGGTDQLTKMDKWMDSSFFSWNIGMLNGFAGKNSDSFGLDQDALATVGSSYGGTASNLLDAADKAGKKYGLFSTKARKKANAAIAEAKSQLNLMGNIADSATDQRLAVQSMGELAGLAYSMMTGGGYDQKYTYAAKQGGILEWESNITLEWEPSLEWEPQVELNWELPKFKEGGNVELVEELEWIPEFKSGGKTEVNDVPEIEETNLKNVIPEGALHKNKHHMEHAEGLTKKGIPVIDDDGEQQAEIEHSEIIFTLEVTRKLEEYYEIFYSEEATNKEKDQAAIDAGKLLVFQILENTEDRTNLIESCKEGGTLTLKKTTDDIVEEVLEWMPTVVIVEEKEVEEKPKNKEEKSDKELMKEAIKEVLIELLIK